jgi:excisionase family DNA binding protein
MQNAQDRTYTTHQIAKMCGVDPITVARWFDSGVLKGYRTPGGHRRVAETELHAFLAHQGISERAGTGAQAGILIIDDDADLLGLLRVQFERVANLRVMTSDSGIDGLLRVGTERPDVVLLDVFMDGLDGRDVYKRIHENPELRHTRVAFMTGKLTPKLRAELEALRPLAIFTKPVDAKMVAAAVVGARRMA